MRGRPGFSLAELMTALFLGSIVAVILGGALVAQLRLARHVAHRATSADALRTAHAVLRGDVGRATAPDLRALASDSIALRAFRGMGDICGAGHDRLLLRYRGDRLPDPRKDSVLIVSGSGAEHTRPVSDSRYTAVPCPLAAGDVGLQVTVPDARGLDQGVALLFESGMYYVSSRAVRYRTGVEGRQPLTAELFVQAGSGFSGAPSGVRLRLTTGRGDSISVIAPLLPVATPGPR